MTEDEWIEQLRKKLEGFEVEPPPELWDRICEKMEAMGYSMSTEPEPVRKKPAVKRWWWAAAAAVLALVGCFFVYQWEGDNLQKQDLLANDGAAEASFEKSAAAPLPCRGGVSVGRGGVSNDTTSQTPETDKIPIVSKTHENPVAPETDEHPVTPETDELPVTPEAEELPVTPEADELPVTPNHPEIHQSPDSPKKWSVGLKASGGLLAANNSVQTEKLYYYQNSPNTSYSYMDYGNVDKTNSFSESYTITEHVAKHQLPLRLGLSLQYQFHPRLALLSGISYTRLNSEFSIPLHQNISYSQKLHYIGIPFGVVWQLWQAHRFTFYCSGGTMVEKCVAVNLEGDYLGKKPWQFSVHAAAGAEYVFSSLLGAYLEPSLGYYFSDGTQLEHYYKEHPLAPSIEFGLRFHVGK